MSDSSEDSKLVSRLANDYLERCRNGESPSISEYADEYPELAEEIRDVFQMMMLMEENGPRDSTCSTPSLINEKFGDFRIKREIGRGGMGVVYEAIQESLNRNVALKVCPLNAGLSPRSRLRFRRESRAAAMLHHTNIVPVFAVGEDEGSLYYAMQLIRGATLDDVIGELKVLLHRPDSSTRLSNVSVGSQRQSEASRVASTLVSEPSNPAEIPATPDEDPSSEVVSLPGQSKEDTKSGLAQYWESVARIGTQVADALGYAHTQGTLHRDIKPGNLMLDDKGIVWVLDFGLAKSLEEDDMTRDGELIGTLRYMAPEQCRGNPTEQSDIYSLGLTIYEMLTFQPAYTETNRTELLRSIAEREPVGPRKLNRKVPRDLETIVMKSIDRDAARRYPTAEALRADLIRFMHGQPIEARPVSASERFEKWVRRRPVIASLCGALVLLFLTSFALISWKWREAEQARVIAVDKEREAASLAKAEGVALAKASENLERAQRLVYRSNINQAQVTSKTDLNTSRQLLRDLIPNTPSEIDHRDWEWGYLTHLVHQELAVLICGAGDSMWVWDIDFSDDNSLVAVAAGLTEYYRPNEKAKGRVTIWNSRTAELVQEIPIDHSGYSVAISPDKKKIAISDVDKPSKFIFACSWIGPTWIWDIESGTKLVEIEKGPTTRVDDLIFTHNGSVLYGTVWPSYSEYAMPRPLEFAAWDATTGEKIWAVADAELLFVDRDGEFVDLSRYEEKHVRRKQYRFSDRELVSESENLHLNRDVYSKSNQFSVSGVTVWLKDRQLGRTTSLSGDDNYVVRSNNREPVCVFHPENGRLFAGATDGSIRIWNTGHGTLDRILRGHGATINCMTISDDGKWLATGDWHGNVRLWQPDNATDQVNLVSRRGYRGSCHVRDFAFHKDKPVVFVLEDQSLNTFEAEGGNLISESQIESRFSHAENNTEFDRYGSRLAIARDDRSVVVIDTASEKEIFNTGSLENDNHELTLSGSGKRVACISRNESKNSELFVWDVAKGRASSPIFSQRHESSRLSTLKLDHDGNQLAFVTTASDPTSPNCIKVVDLGSKETFELESFSGSDTIRALEFSNSGNRLAVCDLAGHLNVYNTQQGDADFGKRIHVASNGPEAIFDLAWNPADTRIAGANREAVTLWAATGESVMTLKSDSRYADQIFHPKVCFSLDGKKIAATQWNSHVRIWSVAEEPERLLNRKASRSSLGPPGQPAKILRAIESITSESADVPSTIALRGLLRSREQLSNLALSDYMTSKESLSDGDPCIMFHGHASIVAPSIPFHEFESFTLEAWVRSGWHPHQLPPVIASQLPPTISDIPTSLSFNQRRTLLNWLAIRDQVHFKAPRWAWESDTWTHFAVCHTDDGQRYFVDGKEVSFADPAIEGAAIKPESSWTKYGVGEPFRIGRTVFGEDLPDLRCLMRSIRVSSTSLYSDSFDPDNSLSPTDDTVLLFDFTLDQGVSNREFEDRSGNGNHGRLTNAWWQK